MAGEQMTLATDLLRLTAVAISEQLKDLVRMAGSGVSSTKTKVMIRFFSPYLGLWNNNPVSDRTDSCNNSW